MDDADAKRIWNDGFNAGLRAAAEIAGADLKYETMELTAMSGNKRRKHLRTADGSQRHADAILALVTAPE